MKRILLFLFFAFFPIVFANADDDRVFTNDDLQKYVRGNSFILPEKRSPAAPSLRGSQAENADRMRELRARDSDLIREIEKVSAELERLRKSLEFWRNNGNVRKRLLEEQQELLKKKSELVAERNSLHAEMARLQ